MGFYGQILYEFSRLFSQINIQNNNNESATAINNDLQASLAPTEQWDRLTLEGGNRWIQLNSNTADKIITISHSEPGAIDESKTVVGFKKINSLPEGAAATELKAGDLIQTILSEYDAAGHSRGATSSYFTLPESETEKNLDDITNRVTELENTYVAEDELDSSIGNYLTNNNYVQEEVLETNISNYLVNNNYITTELTGELNDMYSITTEKSITETIGAIDQNAKSIRSELNRILAVDETNGPIVYTVSEAIQKIIGIIESLQGELSTIKAANRGYEADIKDLTARIEALENTPTE